MRQQPQKTPSNFKATDGFVPSLPGFLLALNWAIPSLLASWALGEVFTLFCLGVTLSAHTWAIPFKLAARALAPEVVGAVEQEAALFSAQARVDVLVEHLHKNLMLQIISVGLLGFTMSQMYGNTFHASVVHLQFGYFEVVNIPSNMQCESEWHLLRPSYVYHTEIEVGDQTCYLIWSQYTDTRSASPSTDSMMLGRWKDSQQSNNF